MIKPRQGYGPAFRGSPEIAEFMKNNHFETLPAIYDDRQDRWYYYNNIGFQNQDTFYALELDHQFYQSPQYKYRDLSSRYGIDHLREALKYAIEKQREAAKKQDEWLTSIAIEICEKYFAEDANSLLNGQYADTNVHFDHVIQVAKLGILEGRKNEITQKT